MADAARSRPVGCDHAAIRGTVIAFVTERSCRRRAWLLLLGEGTSEPSVRGGQARTLAFWESRSGVRDRVLDLRA